MARTVLLLRHDAYNYSFLLCPVMLKLGQLIANHI